MPTVGQMGFRGAHVLGESMPTNLGAVTDQAGLDENRHRDDLQEL